MEEQVPPPKHLVNDKYIALLDKYFPQREYEPYHNYNERMYKLTSKYPSDELIKDLTQQAEIVTNATVKEFNGRFTYIVEYSNKFYTVSNPSSSKDYFNRRNKEIFVGYNGDGAIYDSNDKFVAKLVYTMWTCHPYSFHKTFIGTIGEIIIQLPSEVRNSGRRFYYTIRDYTVHGILKCHCVNVYFYEILS